MLAQASQKGLDITEIGGWIVLLVVAALLLAVIVVAVKHWTFRDEKPVATTAWTLHDLLTLRDSGELTVQQYETLRADLIRDVKKSGAVDDNERESVADRPETASEGDSVA